MRINCQKNDLLFGVTAVARAVSSKNTLPVLGGIMIKAEGREIRLRATDLEMAIECVIPGDVPENGETVVPGKYFIDLVRHLPDGNIALESSGNAEVSIYYEQSQIRVRCFDVNEFPALPEVHGEIHRVMSASLFRKLVKQVSIAAATDEIRPVFTGILLEVDSEKLVMVATDTHRMARALAETSGEGELKVIVPARNMQEMARLSTDDAEPVSIIADKSQVYFKTGNITFISRVISGQFPDYRNVIPSAFNSEVTARRQKIADALERAALLARDQIKGRGNAVKLQLLPEVMFVSAEVKDMGSIKEELTVDFTGEEITANYNVRYLTDALRVLDGEYITIKLTGALTPGIITAKDDESFLYLVLPLRMG